MSELRELYQEVILDHGKKPRNFRKIANATHHADGHNPLCGDRVSVYLTIEDGRISDVSFVGSGCAICTASTSMMTQVLKGMSPDEVEGLFLRFHQLVTGEGDGPVPEDAPPLGKLEVFGGVKEFPVRVKCASLPWHTLRAALQKDAEPVSTE